MLALLCQPSCLVYIDNTFTKIPLMGIFYLKSQMLTERNSPEFQQKEGKHPVRNPK